LWSDTLGSAPGGTGNGWDYASDLALDHEGNLYVHGQAHGLLEGSVAEQEYLASGPFVAMYTAAGARMWLQQYLVGGASTDGSVAFASDRGVLVVRYSDVDSLHEDGSTRWSHDSFRDPYYGLSLTGGHHAPDGDVQVVAVDRSDDERYDLGLYRLDQAGTFLGYDVLGLGVSYLDVTDSAIGPDGATYIVGRTESSLAAALGQTGFGAGAFILRIEQLE
jgi:hypothetical protein